MNKLLPKHAGYYMPAEWHPHERCWMAWPCHLDTWSKLGLERARIAYARVAKAIAQFEPVTLLANPKDVDSARTLCGDGIEIIPLPINDSWIRDTGPTFLLNKTITTHPHRHPECSEGSPIMGNVSSPRRSLAGVDWIHNAWGGNYEDCELDNQIAKAVINQSNAHYFHAPLVMEGGSFHVDGEGTVLTSRECLLNANRNPKLSQHDIEYYLHKYLGTEKVIWLNRGLIGDETDGHVDEIATFVAPGKVLCLVTSDKEDPSYSLLQENLEILKSAQDAKGRQLEVFTVEQPPATFMEGERLTLSYINFYLANGGIVMPKFGHIAHDAAAFELFTQLFPRHVITQIDALDVFAGGGGIHCITQQQPKSST